MTISSLPWFIMFILILSAGAISDKIPKPSDNQKIVTYKFSVCTAKKIETANTMKPTMATNLFN
jgi:hypothetical protein